MGDREWKTTNFRLLVIKYDIDYIRKYIDVCFNGIVNAPVLV